MIGDQPGERRAPGDQPGRGARLRLIGGLVRLPPDCPARTAALVVVEVRDVSLADAPSLLLAACELADVALAPGGAVPFALDVPEVDPRHRLALRVHVDIDGTGAVSAGDLLTTAHVDVPPAGSPRAGIEVPVAVV